MEMEGGCSRDGGGGGRGLRVFFPTAGEEEREHMFDKTVTPSDVGKLNRLVIPKQHAERYFPLDSSSSEKGLLLNFEDRDGKEWRFRYSYWNSSQSYVMTKGWSRFVKEKHLDAGDTVSFSRGMGEAARHRLFIDWKRRPADPLDRARFAFAFASPARAAFMPWGRLLPPPQPPASLYDHLHYQQRHLNYGYTPYPYHLRPPPLTAAASQVPAVQYGGGSSSSGSHAGLDMERAVFNPLLPEAHAKSGVRLFGVNLDHPHLELSLGGSTSSPDAQGSVLRRSGKQPETNYPGR